MILEKFLNLLGFKIGFNIKLPKSIVNTIQQYHSKGLIDIDRYSESCLEASITGFEDVITADDYNLGINFENDDTVILKVKLSCSLSKVINKISKRCAITPERFIAQVLAMDFINLISSGILQN